MSLRRVLLAITSAIGIVVGGWAAFRPLSFYESFPGLGRIWISIDGPFNEHLVRDVGALYLALAGAGVAAMVSRTPDAGRAVGVAWTVFGIPHLAYHLAHLESLAPVDVVGNIVSLGGSLALGVVLMLPGRRPPAPERESADPAPTERNTIR